MSAGGAEFFLGRHQGPTFPSVLPPPTPTPLPTAPWLVRSGLLWQVSPPFRCLFMTATLYLPALPATLVFLPPMLIPPPAIPSADTTPFPPHSSLPWASGSSSPLHLPFGGPSPGSTRPWWRSDLSSCLSIIDGGARWAGLLPLLPLTARKDWEVASCIEVILQMFICSLDVLSVKL